MALDPFTAGFDLIKTGLDKFFPDADTELKGKLEAAASEINNAYQLQLSQLEINKVEAGSVNWLVAGSRPFILWICGFAFLYSSLLEPFLRFICVVFYKYDGVFPIIDTNITMQVMMGLLGLGAFRTIEKIKNVANNR